MLNFQEEYKKYRKLYIKGLRNILEIKPVFLCHKPKYSHFIINHSFYGDFRMKRGEFIRVIGGASIATALAPNYGFSAEGFSKDGILIEAASFKDFGGWVLDTQFYQQMGGNYLLAHGMGEPVENATTELHLQEDGEYYVFVRTNNWCPGNWEAPGRFKIAFNGKKMDTVFGTEAGWGWQSGGKLNLQSRTHSKNKKKRIGVKVELHDLTGFEGRIDAIYLSKTPNPKLPNTSKELFGWKDELTGRSQLQVKTENFDVVIVGGGITGCGAALAAESQGLKVALIQDRPVFGGNASEEVRVHTIGIHGKGSDILKKIDTEHWPNGSSFAKKDQMKREAALKATSVRLFANHSAIGLEKDGNKIVSVEARENNTGIIRRFKSNAFVDCSGDGWLGFWAGAEFKYGRESHKEYGEKWDKFGDLWSPEKADNKVMGTSVLWNSEIGHEPSRFPSVPWADPVSLGHKDTKGEWFWEYSDDKLHQIHDAEKIRDHVLRAIYGNFANAKKDPKNALLQLKFVAFVGGRRESRRIMGDYIFTMKDFESQEFFNDTVVEEKRELDTHYQLKETGEKRDYLSKALFYRHPKKAHGLYYLPFRTLYSKDISNLMIAGRCFSCSHIGLSGPRVMNTCGQMGIATGYAAALCKKYKASPREVGKKYIKELQGLIGYSQA